MKKVVIFSAISVGFCIGWKLYSIYRRKAFQRALADNVKLNEEQQDSDPVICADVEEKVEEFLYNMLDGYDEVAKEISFELVDAAATAKTPAELDTVRGEYLSQLWEFKNSIVNSLSYYPYEPCEGLYTDMIGEIKMKYKHRTGLMKQICDYYGKKKFTPTGLSVSEEKYLKDCIGELYTV